MLNHDDRFYRLMERTFPKDVSQSVRDMAEGLSPEEKKWAFRVFASYLVCVSAVTTFLGFLAGLFVAWMLSQPVGG